MATSTFRLTAAWSLLVLMAGTCATRAGAAAGTLVADFQVDAPLRGRVLAPAPGGGFFADGDNFFQFDATGKRIESFKSGLGPGILADQIVDAGDGGIFVSGVFTIGEYAWNVAKLRADGTVDESFPPLVAYTPIGPDRPEVVGISSIAADGAGGCYVDGNFEFINERNVPSGFARVDRNGEITPWPIRSSAVKMIPLGAELLAVRQTGLWRLDSEGNDRPFPTDDDIVWSSITGAACDARFGIAVIGRGRIAGGTEEAFCAVYNFDGSRRRSFKPAVKFDGGAGGYNNLAWDNAGRIVIGFVEHVVSDPDNSDGGLVNYNSLNGRYSLEGFENARYSMKRLLSDGRLDPAWSRALWFDRPVFRLAVLSDNSVVAVGSFDVVAGHRRSLIVRLTGEDDEKHQPQHSARGWIVPGKQPMIVGLVIEGNRAVDVLVRAAGPSLKRYGVKTTASATKFSVFRGGERFVATGYQTNTKPVTWSAARVGAFPFANETAASEAQALLSLLPGAYTIVVDGADTTEVGEVLGEIYFP